jgi:competence ComEA-like helix-hairpin-helix protein
MKWNEFVTDYLTFTRKDRIGILVIIGLMLIVLFLPMVFSKNRKLNSTTIDTTWAATMKKLEQMEPENNGQQSRQNNNDDNYAYQYDRSTNNYNDLSKRELFLFDPNTISTEEWKKLGLKDRTIHTIQNYLRKGGHFKKPEDLQRIYGLHKDEYERLAPFIKMESAKESNTAKISNESPRAKFFTPRYSLIDINIADTTAFIALPGIGSKLAARIINFRDKLGGFYSIEQLGETFGLPDSTFQKIKQFLKLENSLLKKININTATVDELKAHPYIRWSIANPIIAYRNEHGPFSKIEDIKKVMAVTDEIYNKIAPYLIAK